MPESSRRVGRPSREEKRAGFEAEIFRLYRAGVKIGSADQPGTICAMMKCGRTMIWEVIDRATHTYRCCNETFKGTSAFRKHFMEKDGGHFVFNEEKS